MTASSASVTSCFSSVFAMSSPQTSCLTHNIRRAVWGCQSKNCRRPLLPLHFQLQVRPGRFSTGSALRVAVHDASDAVNLIAHGEMGAVLRIGLGRINANVLAR